MSNIQNQELFQIFETEVNGILIKTVNARDLHSFLESKQDFSTWIFFIFIEGKEYPVEYGKPILFDCTKPHSGDIDSKVWALIIDLLPKQIETSDILKYLVPPSLYYVNKMREEQKQQE